ncbi:hypothetical protein ACOSQ2_020573 [Xanthoceras sorbifolium]
MRKKGRTEEADRISELPEPILHHNLSLLIKTSCTNQCFDYDLRRRNGLFNCVAEIMRNCHCRDLFASFVDQCICPAVGCNVKELKLLFIAECMKWYNLPEILLSANSIGILELQCCKLELPRNRLKLSLIRKLVLTSVYIDYHVIKNLFTLCRGFKRLELFGLTRLNEIRLVHINEVEWLDISVSNVCLLEIFNPAASCEINLAFCKNLTSLILFEIDLCFFICEDENVEPQKYIEFLANFHNFSEGLNLDILRSEVENVVVPRELRETILSPLSNLELLNLRFVPNPTAFTIANVVDGLLWFAPHKRLSLKYGNVEFSFKFTYKKQLIYEGETASCCKSVPISCWHHCMEAV